MGKFNSSQSIGEIVVKFPKAAEIFKENRIDFCCGGNRPLIEAIKELGLDEEMIMNEINSQYENYEASAQDKDWTTAPLDELVEHILNKHHAYLWDEMPKIAKLAMTIMKVHGEHHPELIKVHKLFRTVQMELEEHLTKEETLQYPAINRFLETNSKEDLEKAVNIIDELEKEHTNAGDILKELREITKDYLIPDDVCGTFELTYQKLQEMESDLFQHIHLENNILFPRLRGLL
jgi:regulator of cell morphogenesis and NO signaling